MNITQIERRVRPQFSRLREPSTWAGFAACLELVKVLLPQHALIITGVQAAAGGVAVAMRESANKVLPQDASSEGVAEYLAGVK